MAQVKPLVERTVKETKTQRPFHLVPESESSQAKGEHAQSGLLQENLKLDQNQSNSRREERIRSAVVAAMQNVSMRECGGEVATASPYAYVKDIYPSYAVVEKGGRLFAVPYKESGMKITVGKPRKIKAAYVDDED